MKMHTTQHPKSEFAVAVLFVALDFTLILEISSEVLQLCGSNDILVPNPTT